MKLIYLVFIGENNSKKERVIGVKGRGGILLLLLPLCLLGVGSVIVGY